MFRKVISGALVALGGLWLVTSAAGAATLDDVKSKGAIQCGVNQGLPGFATTNDKGEWTGLDVDFCRALAAAVFGDPAKVKFTPLSAKERFVALQSGEIDVLSRNTSWTMSRDTAQGMNFAGVIYYDGQGFMVRKSLGVTSALQLDGATICTNTGTTTELNVADYFRANKMKYEVVAFEKSDEVVQAYNSGRCDVYTTDSSGLYAQRLKLTNPDEHVVLPEIISKEPLGPVVRHGDDQWFDIVKWTLFALINGEEMGIDSTNADQMKESQNPEIRRFLGVEGTFGEGMGLGNDWAYNIVRKVGNYGELFERNLGPKTKLGIARGLNALWSNDGLQYAPPIR